MIKIVNVVSDTNIGGAGKCLINLCSNFDKNKFEITIVLPRGSKLVEKLKDTGVKIIELDGIKDKSWDIKALWPLIKVLREEAPDIVHTHSSFTARLAARFVKDCKVVYTRHSVFPLSGWTKSIVGRFFYKFVNETLSDRIIAVAEAAKENLIDSGVSDEKIDVILNGVQRIAETSEESKLQLKHKLGIKDDEYVVGILARLEPIKGHEFFIDAAKLILDEKKIKAKFLILGTGSIEEQLKEKVKRLGIEKSIIFTGFIENVQDYINIFDVQVNCSYGTEATSLALLEGMSIGIPAVVTDYGGNPGVIKNGENGYLVPIKSPRDTADSIIRILTNDDLKKYMHKRCVEIYEEKFTVDIYTKNIERIYEEMASEPRIKKINVLDAVIILVVIVACVFGYSYINKKETVIAPRNTTKIVYQVRTNESFPETYDMIAEGTVLYDSIKNYPIGIVSKKEILSSERSELNLTNGTYELTELPREDYIDILLTVEADAYYTDQNIFVGDYIVKVGKEAFIKGKGYAGTGYIVSIER
ncbi:MAG: DUF4330 family protein [Clostridia bacterium]|nr:DUF4330 family protein [Clostridia bacterium]